MKQKAEACLSDLVNRYPLLAKQAGPIAGAAETLVECYRAGGKILVCGNGGSAADAEHMVGELMKGFRLPRPLPEDVVSRLRQAGLADWEHLAKKLQEGVPALSLVGHPPLATAILNDTDPYLVFAQQVYVLGRPGDVVVGFSTSGNSRNVVSALEVARVFGLRTIGLCGQRISQMDEVCDCVIHAPETETHKVQELHLPIYHSLCLAVEEEVFG